MVHKTLEFGRPQGPLVFIKLISNAFKILSKMHDKQYPAMFFELNEKMSLLLHNSRQLEKQSSKNASF